MSGRYIDETELRKRNYVLSVFVTNARGLRRLLAQQGKNLVSRECAYGKGAEWAVQ